MEELTTRINVGITADVISHSKRGGSIRAVLDDLISEEKKKKTTTHIQVKIE